MIVRPRPSAFGLLFIMRGSILPMIAPRVLAVTLASALVTALHQRLPHHVPELGPSAFTLLGLALSIFLGFRNNACYERWWGGRRYWGQLIAVSRGLARELPTLLPDDPVLTRRCARRIIAFAHALRCQLRGATDDAARAFLEPAEWDRLAGRRSRPDAILRGMADDLGLLLRSGRLSDIRYQILSAHMQQMTDIHTACERLRSTPTPFTYTLLLHRTAWIFCLLLPFGMVGTLGLGTPLLTAILAYAFFGLDALGDELEEPFGRSQNALPLDAMTRAIEIAVGEALNDEALPAPATATGFVLS
ncbi:MAG: bestrophin family protein [Janthinobacterium lividum]